MRAMRYGAVLAIAALAGCNLNAMPHFGGGGGGQRVVQTLTPSDAASSLIASGPLTLTRVTFPAPADSGQDPVVNMTLARSDGRVLAFQEANHAPNDVMAQAAGGPLAEAMGLYGGEAPTLYARASEGGAGEPFLCGPEGPAYLGVNQADDGSVLIVGLKSAFNFDTLDDGSTIPVPYSPDHVCARLRFNAAG